jgi:hypothetical protein
MTTQWSGLHAQLLVLEAASGRIVWQIDTGRFWPQAAAFSPDGKTVAVSEGLEMVLLEVGSGQERARLGEGGRSLVFSPDGRFLAGGREKLRLWHLASGQGESFLEGELGVVRSLAFSPDGKRLAVGGSGTTAVICDVTSLVGKKVPEPEPLSANDLEGLWNDLTGPSAACAYQAIQRLATSPRDSVPFLRRRLKGPLGLDDSRLTRLIRDLDDDAFQVREKAAQELESLGPKAEAALRRALEGNPSTEVRSRIQRLLKQRNPGEAPLPSAELIALRVLEVLETANTQEARQALKELGAGPLKSPWTQEAKASLERLSNRSPQP